MSKPRVLCMLPLDTASEGFQRLRETADIVIEPPDRSRLIELIEQFDVLWGHVYLKVDRDVLDRAPQTTACWIGLRPRRNVPGRCYWPA